MAALTSTGPEDAGRRPVMNEDHPRQKSAADYCAHVSWQRPQVLSDALPRLQRAPSATMQTNLRYACSACAQL